MKQEKSRTGTYIAIFIGVVMVASVMGFLWGGQSSGASQKYGQFSFTYRNGQWISNVQGKIIVIRHLPGDLENITVPEDAKTMVSNAGMVYITYSNSTNPQNLALAQYELGNNLATNTRFVINALAYQNPNNATVITCENATQSVPVIMLVESEENNSIFLNKSCIVLEGSPSVVSDRLVYAAYGIIK